MLKAQPGGLRVRCEQMVSCELYKMKPYTSEHRESWDGLEGVGPLEAQVQDKYVDKDSLVMEVNTELLSCVM